MTRQWKTINAVPPRSPKNAIGPIPRATYDALVNKLKEFLNEIEDIDMDMDKAIVLEDELRKLVDMPSIAEESSKELKNGENK